MDREKMGFAIPVAQWLQVELKELVRYHLSEEALNGHGLFNISYVGQIVNDFFDGRKELHLKIWYLLMFQMWHEKWCRTFS
jgi:asparagine synthase (glutamine-hydrolysing)